MRLPPALPVLLALSVAAGPAGAHHLGAIVPRDDEVTLGFKRIRSLIKEGRFDLVASECGDTPLGRRLDEASGRGAPDVRGEVRGAIARRDGPGTERALMRFFLVLVHRLVTEALGRVNDPGQALKLLAAGWRYYNLVDYPLYQQETKAALRVRMAFQDAEFALGGSRAERARYDGAAARAALGKFQGLLREVLERTAPAAPRSALTCGGLLA